MFAVDSNLT